VDSLQWFGPRSPSIPLTMGSTKFSQDARLHLGRSTVGIYQEWSLTIDFLELADSGVYRCGFNVDSLQFINRLNVTEPRLNIIYSGSPVEISVPKQLRYGASVQFACWSYRTGAQEIDLNWSRGLRQSKSLEFVTMPDGSRRNRITCRFKLDNVTLDDGGNYTCVKTLMSNNQ
uniref:Ig-like domain-containing protein n=1 Tax=Macrostomum lignano TaxID=282301 RepID=A0A1I8I837_9PLAT